jgi:hypothetical protein
MLIQSSPFMLHALMNPAAVSASRSHLWSPSSQATYTTDPPVHRNSNSTCAVYSFLYLVLVARVFARLSLILCSLPVRALNKCSRDYLAANGAGIRERASILRDNGGCLHAFSVFIYIRS